MTQQHKSSLRAGMAFMAMIFFVFGFITTFNISLKDQVQTAFSLSSFMAQLVNGVFFFTYFLLSFLCGGVIKKIGYKNGVIAGLLLVAVGSFLFYPAVAIPSYPFFLLAVFIMASGVVFLQTAANPYVAALGAAETSSSRLNLVQALNSIATTIAPFLVGAFVLTPAAIAMGPKAVQVPFLVIGSLVVLIAIGLFFIKLPVISGSDSQRKSVWKYPHVLLGALGIFCYVGAEVGVAAQVVPYLEGVIEKNVAMQFVAIYWGGAMIGRFFGSIMFSAMATAKKYQYSALVILFAFLAGWFVTGFSVQNGAIFLGIAVLNFFAMQLGKGKGDKSLAVFAAIATLLVLTAFVSTGSVGMWALISIGFFNSIMFPNIFALGVKDLDPTEMPMASGIINTLIVGGAVVPVLMGLITDLSGAKMALILPIICYVYIAFYALKGSKIR